MVVTIKGRRWIRCQCMRPSRAVLAAQREGNAPRGWVQQSLLEMDDRKRKAKDDSS